MSSDFAWPLMYQALEIGLMTESYVWFNTDSVTMAQTPTKNISAFTGLLGTRPIASKSMLFRTFFGQSDDPSVSNIDSFSLHISLTNAYSPGKGVRFFPGMNVPHLHSGWKVSFTWRVVKRGLWAYVPHGQMTRRLSGQDIRHWLRLTDSLP